MTKQFLKIFLLATLIIPLFSTTCDAAMVPFRVVNQTGVDINNLYISEDNANNWHEDLLGNTVLHSGEFVEIGFDTRGVIEHYWDLMAVCSDGQRIIWQDIDIARISVITLYADGTADFRLE